METGEFKDRSSVKNNTVIRKTFDEKNTTFIWVRDGTKDKYNSIETQSMGFNEYPQKIVLGEPFSFTTSVVTQKDIYPGYCWTHEPQKLSFALNISTDYFYSSGFTKNIPFEISDCQNSKSSETIHVGGMINASITCEPSGNELRKNSLRYLYECSAFSADGDALPGSKKSWEIQLKLNIKTNAYDKPILDEEGRYILEAPKSERQRFDVDVATNHQYVTHNHPLRLIYEPVYSPSEMLEETGTVQHPLEVNNSSQSDGQEPDSEKTEDSTVLADGADVIREGGNELSESASGRSAKTVNKKDPRERQTGEPTDAGPSTTGTTATSELHPDNPDVARLITEWLTVAEPPQNATEGGNFWYNEWGQLSGTSADGRVATPRGRPETAAGQTSIEYVWAERDRLDSVNHCTVGEFVERRVTGESFEACRGRYNPIVPHLVGIPAAQAKTQLGKIDAKVQWRAGSVPNDPAQAGTVEKQIPSPGTNLKANQPVELWVYRQVAQTASVPDVVGQKIAKAKTILETLGVGIKWMAGSMAKDTAQQGLVEKQQPVPGIDLKNVAQIKLWVYRQAVTTIEVPNVVGMTYRDAAAKLKKAGLQIRVGKISTPITLNPNQKVVTQGTAAGMKVSKETKVVLNFAKEGTKKPRTPLTLRGSKPGAQRLPDFLTREEYKKVRMPNVVGMTYEQAASKLKAAGLKPIRQRGPQAPRRTLAHTVKEAEHPANRLVDVGANIRITVYDAFREKKDRNTIVKRDPASAFGGRKNPAPDRMNCEARVAGLRTSNKKRVANLQHGEVDIRKDGTVDYVCWYVTSRGAEVLVKPTFFVRQPETRESGKKGRNLIAYCDKPAYGDIYAVGAKGKAMNMTIEKYSANKLTKAQLQQLVNFHINQMAPHAISCSASNQPTPKQPSRTPTPLPPLGGLGFNCKDQSNFCRWEGESQGLFGVPGLGGGGYRHCVCGCNTAPESRCKN